MSQSQPDQKSLATLMQKLGFEFIKPELLTEAITHRSYLNEIRHEGNRHNERMEFLGDAVLELVVTDHLFRLFPDRPEGELTSFRAALVRTESLAEEAKSLEIGEFMLMSRGEANSGGRNRPYILANCFEAIIGAIYLDQGYAAAAEFIHTQLLPKLDRIVAERLDIDPKSKLQEVAQEELKSTPIYQLTGETGPDHDKTFEMAVIIAGQQWEVGSGHSKQEAEQQAAAKVLQNWADLYQKYMNSDKIPGTNP
jgi:ribonuclease III